MGPLPDDLKKVIMRYHPGLTEQEFSKYVSLTDGAHMIDPLLYPDRKKEAEREAAAFAKEHMPRLEEAMNAYSSKVEAEYEEAVKSRLVDPVKIARANENVGDWLSGRTGASTTSSRLIEEPYIYIVEFRSPDGSELHVKVDQYNRTATVVFRRMIGP